MNYKFINYDERFKMKMIFNVKKTEKRFERSDVKMMLTYTDSYLQSLRSTAANSDIFQSNVYLLVNDLVSNNLNFFKW